LRGCIVEFLAGDVGVAMDGREVGVAEVLGDQAGIAGRASKPRRGGVAKRVGRDSLLESGADGRAANDARQDRCLQAAATQPAEHRAIGMRSLGPPNGGRL
jgi:hypothetical protein